MDENGTTAPPGPPAQPRRFKPVLRNVGDWIAIAALIPFFISVFALPWLEVHSKIAVFGKPAYSQQFKVIEIPVYLVIILFVVLAAAAVFFFFTRTRGGITIAAGAFYLIFALVFFIGALYKVNAIIGDITSPLKSLPFIGNELSKLAASAIKSRVVVGPTASGYYVFILAGVMFLLAGIVRLVWGKIEQAPAAATESEG